LADWQEKFMKERAVRRRLHEQLQVLRGNIRVMVRVRPPGAGARAVLGYPLDGLLSITPGDGRRYQEFEFDHVFSPDVGQADVFAEVSPLVRSAADGYNVSRCALAPLDRLMRLWSLSVIGPWRVLFTLHLPACA
jgi:hypothetical protein